LTANRVLVEADCGFCAAVAAAAPSVGTTQSAASCTVHLLPGFGHCHALYATHCLIRFTFYCMLPGAFFPGCYEALWSDSFDERQFGSDGADNYSDADPTVGMWNASKREETSVSLRCVQSLCPVGTHRALQLQLYYL